jgi:DNA-binding YbaB/EbfC family protein
MKHLGKQHCRPTSWCQRVLEELSSFSAENKLRSFPGITRITEDRQVFNFKDLMQQAQGMQQRITAMQEELAGKTVTGSAGGDMVRVEVSGAQEVLSIKIEESVLSSGDAELLEDLVVAAVNDALNKSRELMTEEMSKLTGGLRIPGLTG